MTIDTAFFDAIDAQLDLVDAEAAKLAAGASVQLDGLRNDLQAIINKSMPRLSAQFAELEALEAKLAPALALLSMSPADLPGVISFVGDLITHVLTPQLEPYAKAVAQIAETTARVASLVSRMETTASHLHGFTPTIPPFP